MILGCFLVRVSRIVFSAGKVDKELKKALDCLSHTCR